MVLYVQCRVVRSLVGRYGISASDIAVLSHSDAQCSLISHQLQQQFSDVTVSTVNSAYGTHLLLSVCL